MKTVGVGGLTLLEVPTENMDCDGCHLMRKDGMTAMQAAVLSHLCQEQRGCGLVHGLKIYKIVGDTELPVWG